MFGLAARLLSGTLSPIMDRLSAAASRLLWKVAFFALAGLSMLVVLLALTIAFCLWIASMAGTIVGVLAVAGLYLLVALAAVFLALRKPLAAKAETEEVKAEHEQTTAFDAQVDEFTAPLMRVLQRLGLKREQLGVLAGMSVAKQLGPLPLTGLALIAGFLVGRMWKHWRTLLSTDVVASLLSSGLFGFGAADTEPEVEKDTGIA